MLTKARQAFAKGPAIGGKKYHVEIVTGDSQSSDSRAAQVAQQLITASNVDIMLTTSAPETVNPACTSSAWRTSWRRRGPPGS